ncbi:MAG: hypothetical protein LC713_03665, partial [Actinobacteria bacterium]|nr:hypothetical protein [Actinomycetota bacterium]
MAIQPGDDKIVVGGEGQSPALARLLADSGKLDPSFNPCPVAPTGPCNGKVSQHSISYMTALALQPSGKIVTVGRDFDLGRYNSDGTPDADFRPCGGGALPPPCKPLDGRDPKNTDGSTTMAVQPDGRIVVVGLSRHDIYDHSVVDDSWVRPHDLLVARFDPNGVLDDGCPGHPSSVTTHSGVGLFPLPFASAVQPWDGKIVVAGWSENGTHRFPAHNWHRDFWIALARYQGGSPAPAPSEITVEGATVNEPGQGQTEAPFNIKLKLDAPACQPMAFDYATSDESATAGQDYTQTKGTVMFQKGQQEQIIPVPVLADDNPNEPPETFNMSVSNSVGLADPTKPK